MLINEKDIIDKVNKIVKLKKEERYGQRKQTDLLLPWIKIYSICVQQSDWLNMH